MTSRSLPLPFVFVVNTNTYSRRRGYRSYERRDADGTFLLAVCVCVCPRHREVSSAVGKKMCHSEEQEWNLEDDINCDMDGNKVEPKAR